MLAFSAVVSLAYIVQTVWISGAIPWKWLWSVNLRVLVMALLTFVFIRRTNLFAALAFSRRLSFMLVLAVSQSLGLRRTLDDFRLAMHSRGLRRAGLRDRYRAAAHAAGWLLDRALRMPMSRPRPCNHEDCSGDQGRKPGTPLWRQDQSERHQFQHRRGRKNGAAGQ